MKRIFLYCSLFSVSALPAQNPLSSRSAATGNNSLAGSLNEKANSITQYVNPMTGTGGHGHTYPGATSPFGMVQLSPDTRADGSWDGCSGYHYSDKEVLGFSHTHLSGTGCSDYGDILLMPFATNEVKDLKTQSKSTLDHAKEYATAGYYSLMLKDDIFAELTTTPRVGIHRYTFRPNQAPFILLDLKHRDETTGSHYTLLNDTTIVGFRGSRAWAQNQQLWFAIRLSKPVKQLRIQTASGVKTVPARDFPLRFEDGKGLVHALEFARDSQYSVVLRVALSWVDENGALNNLEKEAPHSNFEAYRKQNSVRWGQELGRIEVRSVKEDRKKVFYTALYHCMIAPNIASDVDGRYRGMDNKIHTAEGFDYYSVFSLWDTYRTLHPLLNIIQTKRSNDFIRTFLAMYEQGGRLPVWELAANETNCMIGYHSVSVIADAFAKGIRNWDLNLACKAAEASANQEGFGILKYARQGYLQQEDEHESVSKTLEYAYDDWCIAQLFRAAGNTVKQAEYERRSLAFLALIDPATGQMRPRTNGGFVPDFDPYRVDQNFTEANSWQYSLYAPQNLPLLMQFLPGSLETRLDALFTAEEKTTGREQADMTGFIGQYVHGNEPSHHIAYLYNYTNSRYKTPFYVHQILNKLYNDGPEGLPGNEDCGQMSAWFVMSSMGIYPLCPGKPEYELGSPLFEEISVHLENGKTFRIVAPDAADREAIYPVEVRDDGKVVGGSRIRHGSISSGGSLSWTLSKNSRDMYAVNVPAHEKQDKAIVPAVNVKNKAFRKETQVEIVHIDSTAQIFFLQNVGSSDLFIYSGPFTVDYSVDIRAFARTAGGQNSDTVLCSIRTYPDADLQVDLQTQAMPSYFPNGAEGLIDGVKGTTDWRKGDWLGFQGQNVKIKLDRGHIKAASGVNVRVLRDERAWIFFPSEVIFRYSSDGVEYSKPVSVKIGTQRSDKSEIKIITHKPGLKFRYAEIELVYPGVLPAGHPGEGNPSIQFIDEVEILK